MVGIRSARTVVQCLVDGVPGSRAFRRAHVRTECWGSVTFAGDGSSRTIATATNSAPHPLLPCAAQEPWEVVEGNHHITAEGTGVEPYTPWPPRGRPGLVGPRMGRRSSEMRRHRRTPGPSVFCAGRVTPDRAARTVVFHRRSLVSILWLAASMMCREGVGETENPDGAALNLTTV